jgi:threonine/homoserine/homoserine lactone efflux protein
MQALDEIGAGRAVGLGLLLSAVNPKNLLLTVAATVSVAQAGLSAGDAALVLAVFVIVGSLAVAAAVVTYLVAGDRAEGVLTTWKVWLEHNNAAVMAVLFVVIGVVVFSKGLGPITA